MLSCALATYRQWRLALWRESTLFKVLLDFFCLLAPCFAVLASYKPYWLSILLIFNIAQILHNSAQFGWSNFLKLSGGWHRNLMIPVQICVKFWGFQKGLLAVRAQPALKYFYTVKFICQIIWPPLLLVQNPTAKWLMHRLLAVHNACVNLS